MENALIGFKQFPTDETEFPLTLSYVYVGVPTKRGPHVEKRMQVTLSVSEFDRNMSSVVRKFDSRAGMSINTRLTARNVTSLYITYDYYVWYWK